VLREFDFVVGGAEFSRVAGMAEPFFWWIAIRSTGTSIAGTYAFERSGRQLQPPELRTTMVHADRLALNTGSSTLLPGDVGTFAGNLC
jgi:hypothetical protein